MTSSSTSTAPLSPLVLQGFTAPLALRDFKLAAFDMDSTLITIECIDEIAAAAGRKAEVAAITEAAMRGEITDFKDSLRRRLTLLKGVGEDALAQVLRKIWAFKRISYRAVPEPAETLERAYAEHLAILGALRARDGETARAAMLFHLRSAGAMRGAANIV